LIYSTKKKLQLLFKKTSYWFFKIFYGKIKFYENSKDNTDCNILTSQIDTQFKYSVYFTNNARLYTDTVNNCAIINNQKILSGPSYQIIDTKFETIEKNIVLSIGTPRIKKKLNGKVLSLLTGGAGNHNYWHWLFDVLPRLNIVSNIKRLKDFDFYLFPNLGKNFQKETIDALGIPLEKCISSLKYRHIECEQLVNTDHPYVINNNATYEIQNLPLWIIKWLKKNLTKGIDLKDSQYPKKIFIDRKDASPNVSKRRKIINEEEVKYFLSNNGYKIINLSDYHFNDQMKFFYNAQKITGLHGAGFSNVLFCDKKTQVLELKPSEAGKIFENLAKKCEIMYECITVVPEKYNEKNQMGNININIDELKKKIDD
tara:strand:+ start:606 stop:1718 length:1113 start_codon:yes stop_codon:yes gene_type:complete